MNIEQAVAEAVHASDARLRKSYVVALARGATDTACSDEECLCGTLRLITLAIVRLPDVAMLAQLMYTDGEDRVCCAPPATSPAARFGSRTERWKPMAVTWATRSACGSTTPC
jgi:hypothetical protein